jgi:hypothetical protein
MTRYIPKNPYQQNKASSSAHGAIDFLRTHEKMAALFPSVARMAELQKDCAALLPAVFNSCTVVQFESGCLVFSVPNAAISAKLKQKLPNLQETLQKRGWQVSSIRLKVQVEPSYAKPQHPVSRDKHIPQKALSALSVLESQLDTSSRNAGLKTALRALIERHHKNAG